MATQIIYLLNTTATSPNWFGRVQDNGSAPAGALSAFGWTVAKVAITTEFWRGRIGATARAAVANTSSFIDAATGPTPGTGSGATTAGDSFCSDNPLNGTFAAGNWTFSFGMRTGAATNSGRMRCNVWASVNANGTSARKLNSSTLVGSAVTMNSTSTTFTSSITWAAPQVVLDNEYVFLQVEWEATVAGTSNSCTAQFYQASFTTTNYVYDINSPVGEETASPVIGAPDFEQIAFEVNFAPAPNFATSSPAFTLPNTAAISNIDANDFAVAALALGTAILKQEHDLTATSAVAGVRVFGTATLKQEHGLPAAVAATAGTPVLASGIMSVLIALDAVDIATVGPTLQPRTLVSGIRDLVLGDYVLDNGLTALTTANQMLLCGTAQPATYAAAQATKLASKTGAIFAAPVAGVVGRKSVSIAVSSGVVNADGEAICWAAIDSVNSRLLASGLIDTTPVVTTSAWAMDPVTVHMPRGP